MIWFMLESAAQKSQKTEERAAVENVFEQERDICQHLLYCAPLQSWHLVSIPPDPSLKRVFDACC